MKANIRSEHGWETEIEANTLAGLKRLASKHLNFGCGDLTMVTTEKTYVRRFQQSGNHYKWLPWELVN